MRIRRTRLPVLLFFVGLMVFGTWRTLTATQLKQQRFAALQNEVAVLSAESERLKEEVAFRQSPAYVEDEARNNLKMVKAGERLVVVSDQLPPAAESTATPAAAPAGPVWRQWWGVFFGSGN